MKSILLHESSAKYRFRSSGCLEAPLRLSNGPSYRKRPKEPHLNLFNPKTLKHRTKSTPDVPGEHLTVLKNWAEMIKSGKILSHKETSLHGEFKSKVIEAVLGYSGPVGQSEYTVESEQKILKGAVDLALGHFSTEKSEIIAPFELKGAKTKDLDAIMPGRNKTPVQQAWEYATNNVGTK
jgi:hypothetical protein